MVETQGLIKQGMESNPESEYQRLSQGTDTSGLLNQGDGGFNAGLGYGDQAMSQAIRSKYSQPYQTQMQGMQNKMKLDSRNAHFQKILTAHQLANEEANLNFQKAVMTYKQKKAKQSARQAIVGQVLGLVGGVVGTAYGGPAGGMAGSAAGQGAAQAGITNLGGS